MTLAKTQKTRESSRVFGFKRKFEVEITAPQSSGSLFQAENLERKKTAIEKEGRRPLFFGSAQMIP